MDVRMSSILFRSIFALQGIGRSWPAPATDRRGAPQLLSVAVLMSVAITGCATRVENVLQPPQVAVAASDASRVNMLVATTRKSSDDPGQLYSGERGTAISLNNVSVSIPPDRNRKIGKVQWPSRVPPNPQKEFAVLEAGKVATEGQAFKWFRKNRNAKRQVLIFVHGFNNTYADAVFRFAQIVHDSGTDAAPILFAWPSRARVFDYLYDKESANYSRRALEDLILQATTKPRCRRRDHSRAFDGDVARGGGTARCCHARKIDTGQGQECRSLHRQTSISMCFAVSSSKWDQSGRILRS